MGVGCQRDALAAFTPGGETRYTWYSMLGGAPRSV